MKRNDYLVSLYGITSDTYEKLLKYQEGVCAICSRPAKKRRLAVDHSHATGEVRGLLCWLCNRGLAFYHDNPILARKMAQYLENPPYKQLVGRWADSQKTTLPKELTSGQHSEISSHRKSSFQIHLPKPDVKSE